MAKKFIKVNGLHNIFDSENDRYDTQILSEEKVDSNIINEYSICFITADEEDSTLNSLYAGTYIWTRGVLFPCKDTEELKQHVNDLMIDVGDLQTEVSRKQNTLIAGTGIQITGNTISVIDNVSPIGSITMWPLSTPPTGWLICNGQSIATGDQYANLRAVLGTDSVPDLTGKFPLGESQSHAAGTTGGEEEHTLNLDEMPSHSHTLSKGYHYGGSSELSPDVTINTYNLNSRNVRQATADALTPEDLNPVNYVDLNGSGLAHNNMPPYFTLNFIIKYA